MLPTLLPPLFQPHRLLPLPSHFASKVQLPSLRFSPIPQPSPLLPPHSQTIFCANIRPKLRVPCPHIFPPKLPSLPTHSPLQLIPTSSNRPMSHLPSKTRLKLLLNQQLNSILLPVRHNQIPLQVATPRLRARNNTFIQSCATSTPLLRWKQLQKLNSQALWTNLSTTNLRMLMCLSQSSSPAFATCSTTWTP